MAFPILPSLVRITSVSASVLVAANLGDRLLLDPANISFSRGADGCKLALGEGGFGSVFKGEVLPGGLEVAIKVVKVGISHDVGVVNF